MPYTSKGKASDYKRANRVDSKAYSENTGGRWVTIRGIKVFIRDGETPAQAIANRRRERAGKDRVKTVKERREEQQQKEATEKSIERHKNKPEKTFKQRKSVRQDKATLDYLKKLDRRISEGKEPFWGQKKFK